MVKADGDHFDALWKDGVTNDCKNCHRTVKSRRMMVTGWKSGVLCDALTGWTTNLFRVRIC